MTSPPGILVIAGMSEAEGHRAASSSPGRWGRLEVDAGDGHCDLPRISGVTTGARRGASDEKIFFFFAVFFFFFFFFFFFVLFFFFFPPPLEGARRLASSRFNPPSLGELSARAVRTLRYNERPENSTRRRRRSPPTSPMRRMVVLGLVLIRTLRTTGSYFPTITTGLIGASTNTASDGDVG